MSYGHPTTLRHPRTMRLSGTDYAASIERARRTDWSGIWIVLGVAGFMALAFFVKSITSA